jgi:hypothetical protein
LQLLKQKCVNCENVAVETFFINSPFWMRIVASIGVSRTKKAARMMSILLTQNDE